MGRLISLLALLLVVASTPAAVNAANPRASVVPIDVMPGAAPAAVGGAGRNHLLYELRLTNFAARTLALESVEVVDPASGAVLATHSGAELADMIVTPGLTKQGDAALSLDAGDFAILFFDTALPQAATVPTSIVHRLRFRSDRADAPPSRTLIETVPLQIRRAEPVTLGAPLQGSGWLAANALSNASDHRRTIAVIDGQARIAQRYAIDFVQLDGEGRSFVGDPTANQSWTGYGAPVLAVADGVVEAVRDGLADNQPMSTAAGPITVDTIAGNTIVLDIGGDRYVLYGHLKPGSIRVSEGQRVRMGQVLAQVGNSGQSDAPHLHIHVADGAHPLGAEGLPFSFGRFRVEGAVPSLEILGDPRGWQRPVAQMHELRTSELPVDNEVIRFGD